MHLIVSHEAGCGCPQDAAPVPQVSVIVPYIQNIYRQMTRLVECKNWFHQSEFSTALAGAEVHDQ